MGQYGLPSFLTPMPARRPKLMLDEQSFQDMLAAAFTIQEHNAQRQKSVRPAARTCGQCGGPTEDDAPICRHCAEGPRPGEELQRKWASLWLMSQEQSMRQEGLSGADTESPNETATAIYPGRRFAEPIEIPQAAEEFAGFAESEEGSKETDSIAAALMTVPGGAVRDSDTESISLPTADEPATMGLRDLRLKLRFHRADFYLVVAVAVSTLAMVWVLSATPAPSAHRKPRLRPWERALVSLGLAEAPEPPPHRGDPNISVWVDPKTALYYCAGEELYGKAPGGHLATQREAQLDQFEPAGRAACE